MYTPNIAGAAASSLLSMVEQELTGAALPATLGPEAGAVPARLWDRALLGPLRSFLSRPGKQVRASVVQTCFELAGGAQDGCPAEATAAIELLHAGSLIVDDIEDASLERRGAPALHEQVGLPLALNTGNYLYFLPMGLLDRLSLPPERALALHRELRRTLLRCHCGQALDLAVRVGDLPQAEVAAVVAAVTQLKTASLFELAACVGAQVAGVEGEERAACLARLAREVGAALQMLDDLSALTSPRRVRKCYEDLGQERPIWPWAWAAQDLDQVSYARLQRLSRRVGSRDDHPELLAEALRQVLGGSGRLRVRSHLAGAFDEAEAALGASPVLERLRAEMEHLEEAYG
jgi:geranylgeranyl pyrophosphate synthase